MQLYCVRHGESTYNAEGRVQGRLEVPLSELGKRQAKAVGTALEGKPIEILYASTQLRARETACIVSAVLGVAVQPEPQLMEINVGVFQGHRRCELAELYPEAFAQWSSGDPNFMIPGGESRRQVAERGREVFQRIRAAGHREVLIVAHGGILLATMKLLAGIPLDQLPLSLENGSITTLQWTADGPLEILALNQVDHLSSVGLAGGGDLSV